VNECTRFEALLEAEIAGEIAAAEAAALRAHCAACESCRSLLALHEELARLGADVDEPTEAELDAVTAGVLPQSSRRSGALRRGAAIAAGLVLFLAGLVSGRALTGGDEPERGLVATLSAEAASNDALSDVENSRFTYSNVSLRDAGPDRVDLSFDVTTHVQLVEPLQSVLVREVLAQALLDRSSTGARLQAMSYAAGSLEPKVREALILSLESDPSLAVRLKALELLSRHLDQADVEAAVIATLRDDGAVQVRLEALEVLAAHRVDHGRIRDVIEEGGRPGNEALLVRLAKLPT
jgi:hypothetical protein